MDIDRGKMLKYGDLLNDALSQTPLGIAKMMKMAPGYVQSLREGGY